MGLFNSYTKPGKGVSKEDLDKTGIALYFDIFARRFWKFISINFMYVIASIPAIIISSFIAYYLMGIVISVMKINVTENILTLIRYLIIPATVFVLQITGSGPASVAKNYMLRKYVKDTHVWIWADFVSSFKQNFVQGMIVYVINILIFFALCFGFLFYKFMMPGGMSSILSTVIIVMSVIFFVMQKYVYMLVSGFELKTKHIYKNAFILAIVGLKWNLLSTVIVVALMIGCSYLYTYIPAIAVAVIICIYFSIVTFTQMFITRSVVTKYLEEPAMEQEKEEISEDKDED